MLPYELAKARPWNEWATSRAVFACMLEHAKHALRKVAHALKKIGLEKRILNEKLQIYHFLNFINSYIFLFLFQKHSKQLNFTIFLVIELAQNIINRNFL